MAAGTHGRRVLRAQGSHRPPQSARTAEKDTESQETESQETLPANTDCRQEFTRTMSPNILALATETPGRSLLDNLYSRLGYF